HLGQIVESRFQFHCIFPLCCAQSPRGAWGHVILEGRLTAKPGKGPFRRERVRLRRRADPHHPCCSACRGPLHRARWSTALPPRNASTKNAPPTPCAAATRPTS